MHDALADLRFSDLSTFLAVKRCASITGAARELNVTPSQVSKAIARLELQLGIKVLSRSSRGVSLSDAGLHIVPHVEGAFAQLAQIRRPDVGAAPELTVAAPSYLSALLLPAIAQAQTKLRIRSIELPPALVRALVGENFFDVTLIPESGVARLPSAWVSEGIGAMRKALFATPALAKKLGTQPILPERLRDVPFVLPIYNLNGQFVAADDDCPITPSDRTGGHQVTTFSVGLEFAARTDHLIFGPVIAARRHIASGALVEVRVRGWSVTEDLFVACNGDRVLARVRSAIVAALSAELAAVDPP